MAKLDAFRKLIREEVKAVFQEELATILKEAIVANRQSAPIVEQKKPTVPGTLNNRASFRPPSAPVLSAGNPLNEMLQQTANSMIPQDYQYLNGEMVQNEPVIVESVQDMFANTRPSSNLEAIEINAVPDFTQLMSKLKANGDI
jgi:hypothetical protein